MDLDGTVAAGEAPTLAFALNVRAAVFLYQRIVGYGTGGAVWARKLGLGLFFALFDVFYCKLLMSKSTKKRETLLVDGLRSLVFCSFYQSCGEEFV